MSATIRAGGNSRRAQKRRERAGELAQRMHHGDSDAAWRLLQRRRALAGIKKHGWSFKVHAMLAARNQKRQQRVEAAALDAERARLASGHRLTGKVLAALRARFGTGFSGNRGDNECDAVLPVPGVRCAKCGWQYGDREPHIIGVP